MRLLLNNHKMDFLDPEEEFEMMHADELEMMNEMDFENDGNMNK